MNEEIVESVHAVRRAVYNVCSQLNNVVTADCLGALDLALAELEQTLMNESENARVDCEYPLTCKEAMTLAFNKDKKVISEITPGLIQYFDENKAFCYKYGNGKISYSELTKEEINAHWKVVE